MEKEKSKRMRIIIGGDFFVSKENLNWFSNGKIENVFSDDLLDLWYKSDFRLFNLEAPLCGDKCNKIQKCGPNLRIEESAITGIQKLNPNLICLSNNHIMDYGVDGLKQTINILNTHRINNIGVGENYDKARLNSVFFFGDIAIINCCEHEFSVASEIKAGAFPYSQKDIEELITQAKKKNKYVIVIYHGGKEEFRFPTPELRKRCTFMASLGADFITCQHTHCIGSFGIENNCTILYGQGNFLFKGYKNNEYWKTGLLVEIDTIDKKIIYHPIINDKKIRLASSEEKENIYKGFFTRSKNIENHDYIERVFNNYVQEKSVSYFCKVFCFSKARTWLEKKLFKGFFVKKKLKKHSGLVLYNVLTCEPHNEIIRRAIEMVSLNKKDKS